MSERHLSTKVVCGYYSPIEAGELADQIISILEEADQQ
jgi:hypothetical protein